MFSVKAEPTMKFEFDLLVNEKQIVQRDVLLERELKGSVKGKLLVTNLRILFFPEVQVGSHKMLEMANAALLIVNVIPTLRQVVFFAKNFRVFKFIILEKFEEFYHSIFSSTGQKILPV